MKRIGLLKMMSCLAVLAAMLFIAPASAQQPYPSKPIRILTSTAGGPYDIAMRGLSVPLSQALGQSIVIENRTGGSFIPLAEGCAHATPDGYTLCSSDSFAQSLNPLLFAKLPYETREFAPIIFIGSLNSVILEGSTKSFWPTRRWWRSS